MKNQYANLITEFESRIRKLISKYKALQVENETLKAELGRKQEDLMRAHKDILELRNDYSLLQTAMGIYGSDEERESSRQHLNKIVREIDKCLALLNE